MPPSTVQLRALMDARNSSDAWDLRGLVREKLLEYLQKNHPESLPRYRGELQGISEQANVQMRMKKASSAQV